MPVELKSPIANGWYTVSQACELIPGRDGRPVTSQTLRNWIKDGRVRARKIGKTHFVQGREIERVLNGGGEIG